MRVITGKGEEIREYIKTISDKNDVIIFPENGLDLEEQSLFIENKLSEGFNGDIITFSAYIVSDTPTGLVYNLNLEKKKFKLEKNHDHKFGNGVDLITTVVMGKYQSCSSLAIKELEKIRKDVYDGVDKQELMVKMAQLGDSFEKMNVINVLRKREKTLENIIGQYNESQNPQQDTTEKETSLENQVSNRKKVIFIKDSERDSVHFVSDVEGLESDADLWFSLEKSKSLFENVEKILIGLKEANNLTNIKQLNDFDFEAEYNIYQNEEKLDEKPLETIIKQYEGSIIADTSLDEAKQLVEKDNTPTPKLHKQR